MPELTELVWLLAAAFLAGLFDAAVGGGGLIQIPAMFTLLPGVNPATLLGTNKLASILGTASAAWHFHKNLKLNLRFLKVAVPLAVIGAFLGASVVAWLPTEWVRPIILFLLILMLIKTWFEKQAGLLHSDKAWVSLALIATAGIGVYDGFFGPGTGSFLIFVFVRWLGHDFLHASAHGKVINSGTNFGALIYFTLSGHVMWTLGLIMASANILGAQVGARLAIKGGATLVRQLFLFLCLVLIIRLAWTLYFTG